MSSNHLYAACVTGRRAVEIASLQRRALERGEVRLAVDQCGIGDSDLRVWQSGTRTAPPAPVGHEIGGTVIESRPGSLTVGQRVAAWGPNAHGLATEAIVEAGRCFPVSREVRVPFAAGPLSRVVKILEAANPPRGAVTLVVGASFSALLMVMLTYKTMDPKRLVIASRKPGVLGLARALGATHALDPAELPRYVSHLTSGRGADIVYDFTGGRTDLDTTALVATRGTLMVADRPDSEGVSRLTPNLRPRLREVHFWDEEQIRAGVGSAVGLLNRGTIDPSPLVAGTFPLSRVDEAFRAAAGGRKIVVTPMT